jgi:hypothetical protein
MLSVVELIQLDPYAASSKMQLCQCFYRRWLSRLLSLQAMSWAATPVIDDMEGH